MRIVFWKLAHQILIEEKDHNLADVSRALGMEYGTLYSRLNGRTPFRLDEACKLLARIPDQRLADALLQDSSYVATPCFSASGWGGGEDVIDLGVQSALRLLELLQSINKMKSGHQINVSDRDLLEGHVRAAERAVAQLRLALPHLSAAAAPPRSSTRGIV